MCSPNISSPCRRKFRNPCAASRCARNSSRRLSALFFCIAILAAAGAEAQIERRELPVLEGEPAAPPEAPPPQRPAPQAPLPREAEPGIGYPEGAAREDYPEPPLDLRPQARPAPRGYDPAYDMPPDAREEMAPPAHE